MSVSPLACPLTDATHLHRAADKPKANQGMNASLLEQAVRMVRQPGGQEKGVKQLCLALIIENQHERPQTLPDVDLRAGRHALDSRALSQSPSITLLRAIL